MRVEEVAAGNGELPARNATEDHVLRESSESLRIATSPRKWRKKPSKGFAARWERWSRMQAGRPQPSVAGVISFENARKILMDLVAIPSINPMGRPYTGSEPVEHKAVEYLEGLFRTYGAATSRQSCGNHHENLAVVVPGKRTDRVVVFESHIDTVPADDWLDRALSPRVVGTKLFGRGACDDKGSLASMAMAALGLLESSETPPYSVLFLATGDEEYAQTGIKEFIKGKWAIHRAVVGEPTSIRPVVQHKGTVRWDITVHGRSAHSSSAELGRNAILGMLEVISHLEKCQTELRQRWTNPLMTGSTLTVTTISGGRTRNAVPDECTIAVDVRFVPGMKGDEVRDRVVRELGNLEWDVTHSAVQLLTPPLETKPDDPFCLHVLAICQRHAGEGVAIEGAAYGTDASWIAPFAPTVVLGPGNIRYAHAIDEQIDLDEVVTCAHVYHDIMLNPD